VRTLRVGWRPVAGAAGAVVALVATGCYSLQPVRGATPPLGARVAFDVNDAGRVVLGGVMGPGIAQVQGRLLEQGNDGYLVAVSGIRLLRGGEQPWAGEEVRIRSDHVTTTYERRLSRPRTVAASATAVAIVAFFVTRSLSGSGSPDARNPIDSAQARRYPWPSISFPFP
jgi:hypothetical protein